MRFLGGILILSIILLASCNSDGISTNEQGEKVFTYKPIKWEMQVPENWTVLTETERMKLAYKAENFYEDGNSKDKNDKEIILGIKKPGAEINALYAFTRKYKKGEDPPDLADLLDAQYRQYSSGEYKAYKSLTQEHIGGNTFDKAVLSVKYNGKPYFTYTTYSTMLQDMNFGVSITANNNEDEEMLISNFTRSVGSIKK